MLTIYEILADPTRRRILDLIREKPRLVGELAELLKITQPGVSKQLKVLRDANLVEVRHDAQRHWYELRAEPLAEIDSWLAKYRRFWETKYDRLDQLLADLQTEEDKEDG